MGTLSAIARLLIDIASMKLFVRLLGANGELLDSHLFFYARFTELAEQLEKKGLAKQAQRCFAIAEAHFQAAPDDDDDPAAASMAMPIPRYFRTDAVSRTHLKPPRPSKPSLSPLEV